MAQHDQQADAGEHAVHDGRRDRAKPVTDTQRTGDNLERAGKKDDKAQGHNALFLHDFENEHGEARRRSADLQGRASQKTDDDAADDSGHKTGFRRHPRSDGNAHAERQCYQEDDQ